MQLLSKPYVGGMCWCIYIYILYAYLGYSSKGTQLFPFEFCPFFLVKKLFHGLLKTVSMKDLGEVALQSRLSQPERSRGVSLWLGPGSPPKTVGFHSWFESFEWFHFKFFWQTELLFWFVAHSWDGKWKPLLLNWRIFGGFIMLRNAGVRFTSRKQKRAHESWITSRSTQYVQPYRPRSLFCLKKDRKKHHSSCTTSLHW